MRDIVMREYINFFLLQCFRILHFARELLGTARTVIVFRVNLQVFYFMVF